VSRPDAVRAVERQLDELESQLEGMLGEGQAHPTLRAEELAYTYRLDDSTI